jgi:Zn-finger nucleic acid-binding protein
VNYSRYPLVVPVMKCPVDSVDLIMSERSGVEIDYCPQCRGVWLDRGELDKIIDRAADSFGGAAGPGEPPAPPAAGMVPPPLYQNQEPRRDQPRYDKPSYDKPGYDKPRYDDRGYGKGYDREYDRRRPKKKEGWLGDLFDF